MNLLYMIAYAFALCLIAATAVLADGKIERIGPAFNHPWGMDFIDDNNVLITERRGNLYRLDLNTGERTEISGVPDVFHVGQGGLLDVMAPEDDPGRIYLCYARETEDGGATAIDKAILEGDQLVDQVTMFTSNTASGGGRHFGCRLEVKGEHIYATFGDRGARFDAQDPKSDSGSVIRLNRDGSWPQDNPKIDNKLVPNFTKGQRNPQGMALNPATGEIWLHEHGPRGGDEINIVRSGKNYGWPEVSHGEEYAGGKIGRGVSAPEFEDPIWVWVPSIAPSGMAFYQGDMFEEYDGHLLVGSLKFKSLYLVKLEDNLPVSEEVILKDEIGRIRDVTVGKDGAIYLLTDERRGGLYRLAK